MTITEHGYVIQFEPDDSGLPPIVVRTFASNRRECWRLFCGQDELQNSCRARWKKSGARCVPATRTIQTEEA